MCSKFKRSFFIILVRTCYCRCKLGDNFFLKKSIYCYASHFTVNQGHMNYVKSLDQVCLVDDKSHCRKNNEINNENNGR